MVANAKPDGYSFLIGTGGTHGVNAAHYKRLSFDVESDFTPISTLVDVSKVLAIDARDVKDSSPRLRPRPDSFQLIPWTENTEISNITRTSPAVA